MSFWKKLFGCDDGDKNVSSETSPIIDTSRKEENKIVTLEDVCTFVAEIQSYYLNDNFKNQSEYISNSQCEVKARFLEKKLYFEKLAENRITSILTELRKLEADSRSIWGKSIYSFYEELEKNKMESLYEQVFSIVIQLRTINVKKELDPIIFSRLNKFRDSWNVSQTIDIPESSAINIVSLDEQKEIYQIGTQFVRVKSFQPVKRKLNEAEYDKIGNIEVELDFENPSEFIMVKFASVDRKQITLLAKTAILPNTWQFCEEPKIEFMVIKKSELSNLVKSMLQLTLAFNQYFVISVMNLNSYILTALKDVIIKENQKVEVKDIFQFVWAERSEKYKDNWKVAYIKRKYIPQKIIFQNFNELRKNFK